MVSYHQSSFCLVGLLPDLHRLQFIDMWNWSRADRVWCDHGWHL